MNYSTKHYILLEPIHLIDKIDNTCDWLTSAWCMVTVIPQISVQVCSQGVLGMAVSLLKIGAG